MEKRPKNNNPLYFDNRHWYLVDGEDFTVSKKGFSKIHVHFFGYGGHNRHTMMSVNATNLLVLNSKLNEGNLLGILLKMESSTGATSLGLEVITAIVVRVFAKKYNNSLKGVFCSKSKYKLVSRHRNGTGKYQEIKREQSEFKMYKIIESWDYNSGRITQARIAKKMKLGKSTISKYFKEDPEYRPMVEYLNKLHKDKWTVQVDTEICVVVGDKEETVPAIIIFDKVEYELIKTYPNIIPFLDHLIYKEVIIKPPDRHYVPF